MVYQNIEYAIAGLLAVEAENKQAKKPKDVDNIAKIVSLTESLMEKAPKGMDGPNHGYTHSVCHLFEKYGRGPSYLNSPDLFDTAEKLVNVTIAQAIEAGSPVGSRYPDLLCVDRIITPILLFNLDHMDETAGGFAFKPSMLSDPDFVKDYEKHIKREFQNRKGPEGYTLEFCKARSMNEFFAGYLAGLKQATGNESDTDDTLLSGVYVDVDDTLIHHKKLDDAAHKYLIKKLDEGMPVTVFTGGDPKEAAANLKECGADERLLDVKSKAGYIGKTLEICIDDTPPLRQGFRAKIYYSSGEAAADAKAKGA